MPAYFGPSNRTGGFNIFKESIAPTYNRDSTRMFAGTAVDQETGKRTGYTRTGTREGNPFTAPAEGTIGFDELPEAERRQAEAAGISRDTRFKPRFLEDADVAQDLREAGVKGELGEYSERRQGRYMVRQYGNAGIVYDTRTNQRRFVSDLSQNTDLGSYFAEGATTGNPFRVR